MKHNQGQDESLHLKEALDKIITMTNEIAKNAFFVSNLLAFDVTNFEFLDQKVLQNKLNDSNVDVKDVLTDLKKEPTEEKSSHKYQQEKFNLFTKQVGIENRSNENSLTLIKPKDIKKEYIEEEPFPLNLNNDELPSVKLEPEESILVKQESENENEMKKEPSEAIINEDENNAIKTVLNDTKITALLSPSRSKSPIPLSSSSPSRLITTPSVSSDHEETFLPPPSSSNKQIITNCGDTKSNVEKTPDELSIGLGPVNPENQWHMVISPDGGAWRFGSISPDSSHQQETSLSLPSSTILWKGPDSTKSADIYAKDTAEVIKEGLGPLKPQKKKRQNKLTPRQPKNKSSLSKDNALIKKNRLGPVKPEKKTRQRQNKLLRSHPMKFSSEIPPWISSQLKKTSLSLPSSRHPKKKSSLSSALYKKIAHSHPRTNIAKEELPLTYSDLKPIKDKYPPYSTPAKRPLCKDYTEKGLCLHGHFCEFFHGNDAVVLPTSYDRAYLGLHRALSVDIQKRKRRDMGRARVLDPLQNEKQENSDERSVDSSLEDERNLAKNQIVQEDLDVGDLEALVRIKKEELQSLYDVDSVTNSDIDLYDNEIEDMNRQQEKDDLEEGEIL